jgi:hypothetical protein
MDNFGFVPFEDFEVKFKISNFKFEFNFEIAKFQYHSYPITDMNYKKFFKQKKTPSVSIIVCFLSQKDEKKENIWKQWIIFRPVKPPIQHLSNQ